jgi:N-acetylneuraminate synthase
MIETESICIGEGHPCFIIAEVAQAHDGSLGMAYAYIDAVAKTGANAIKFQTHIAAEESSSEEPWRVKFSYQDETRYDYWKRMEFTEEQWLGLKQHADKMGLIFLSSPFSIEAVRLLDEIQTPMWKVASGEVNSMYLLEAMVNTGKPIIMSSGMSYIEELDERAAYFKDAGVMWAILECTTSYPTQPEQIDLAQMSYYRQRYGCAVGLSDHSGTIYAGLAGAALGADIIEVHVCFSKELFGPDVKASLTTDELKNMVDGVRFIDRMRNVKDDKQTRTTRLEELRKMFGKGIITRFDIKKGELFTMENIAFVKPAKGIGTGEWKKVLSSTASRDIPAKTFLTADMLF